MQIEVIYELRQDKDLAIITAPNLSEFDAPNKLNIYMINTFNNWLL